MLMPMKDFVRNLLEPLNPVESAKYSFTNYHCPGLTYLNLLRTPNLTVKLYLTESGVTHAEPLATGGWLVNPHSHRYNFETYVLRGCVEHFVFEERSDGLPFTRYGYRSVLSGGTGFVREGAVRLATATRRRLKPYSHVFTNHYYLPTNKVHTIAVAPGEPTVQLQLQYTDLEEPKTLFYTMADAPPSVTGLYLPMTPAQVIACATRIKELLFHAEP